MSMRFFKVKNMLGKNNGPKIIDGAIQQFQGIIDSLDTGITACENKEATNTKTIETLTAENITLDDKKVQATTFRDNLSNMLINDSFPASSTEK